MSSNFYNKNLSPKEIVFIIIGVILCVVAFTIRDYYSELAGDIILLSVILIGTVIAVTYESKNKKNKETTKDRIKSGFYIIKDSVYTFGKYPRLLLPLLFVWFVYAPTILYLKFFLEWKEYSVQEQIGIVTAVIFGFSFLLTLSCLVLLELLQQQETGKRMSIIMAIFPAIFRDLFKALPIAIMWAIIWLILSIIDAMLSRFRRGGEDEDADFSPENAAKTLAGFEEFSLSGASIEALKKGVRMTAFLILPAIAWDDKPAIKAYKKGTAIAKTHFVEFMTGFVGTELAAGLIFLPPALLFLITGRLDINLPDVIWYIAIIYIGFAWSFSFFLEQMFTAELYLWHLYWEKEYAIAKKTGSTIPKLSEVKRPTLLDEIPDLQVLKRKVR